MVAVAHDPQQVLQGLNRVLFPQLHAQLVSAAYLWLDTENHTALYSAAGHPPLLHCRDGAPGAIPMTSINPNESKH